MLSRQDRIQLARVEKELAALTKTSAAKADGEDLAQRIAALEKQRRQIEKRRRRTMITVALPQPRTIRFLPRGNWLDESGPVVEPAVPKFLGHLNTSGRATRLDLANWLTDAESGVGLLTARVMVNRFWYLCFGVGLCQSLEDFGNQGRPPVHPELLDNLAIEFVESGWNVKHIIKLLVMSRTYRQTSDTSEQLRREDPDNSLMARQSRFRLPAETIRDSALSVAGLLVNEHGGASVKPYQPAGYYRHLNFPKRRYAFHADHRQWRRGVYVHWQRQFLHPMLKAFDAPSREECTARRPRSNTPLASLVLLNDPTFVEAARALAQQALLETGDDDDARVRLAFRIAISRYPDPTELEMLRSLLEAARRQYDKHPEEASALLEVGEQPFDASIYSRELAAWTSVTRAIINLSEFTTRR